MDPASPIVAAAARVEPALGREGRGIVEALLRWYGANARRLAWRPERPDQRDPWATWVSEVMLQQTRVETVNRSYEPFMARFPTVQSMASAPLHDVLTCWSGLGYYSRARNLHAGAVLVAAVGRFPADEAGWRALPGVGSYMAGAIGSISQGLDLPAVDGNAVRVLSRLWAAQGSVNDFSRLARAMLPLGRAGEFNQALMDLGSLVCTPRSPRCEACPLRERCRGFALGLVDQLPPVVRRAEAPRREAVGLVLEEEGRLLLARRPPSGLYGGLFELPGDLLQEGESLEEAVRRVGEERLGRVLDPGPELGSVSHTLSHMKLVLRLVRVRGEGLLLADEGFYTELSWVDPAAPGAIPLSRLAHKAFERLLSQADRPR